MISDWLTAIATLVANCTSPNVATRVGESSAANVIANRIVYDHYEDLVDAIHAMPYFVMRESGMSAGRFTVQDSAFRGSVLVEYFEHASQYLDTEDLNSRHKQSRAYFVDFLGDLALCCMQNQGRGIYTLPVSNISLVYPAERTPMSQVDPQDAHTDFWHAGLMFEFVATD